MARSSADAETSSKQVARRLVSEGIRDEEE